VRSCKPNPDKVLQALPGSFRRAGFVEGNQHSQAAPAHWT